MCSMNLETFYCKNANLKLKNANLKQILIFLNSSKKKLNKLIKNCFKKTHIDTTIHISGFYSY